MHSTRALSQLIPLAQKRSLSPSFTRQQGESVISSIQQQHLATGRANYALSYSISFLAACQAFDDEAGFLVAGLTRRDELAKVGAGIEWRGGCSLNTGNKTESGDGLAEDRDGDHFGDLDLGCCLRRRVVTKSKLA